MTNREQALGQRSGTRRSLEVRQNRALRAGQAVSLCRPLSRCDYFQTPVATSSWPGEALVAPLYLTSTMPTLPSLKASFV